MNCCSYANDWTKSATRKFLRGAYTSRRRSHPHSDRSWQEQITLMQPYKEYFVEGSALLVHPFSPDWYVGGSVFGVRAPQFNRSNHALSASPVHRKYQRTSGMVRPGDCPDRRGRMPGSATEQGAIIFVNKNLTCPIVGSVQ
jgi:hypothetical protein